MYDKLLPISLRKVAEYFYVKKVLLIIRTE